MISFFFNSNIINSITKLKKELIANNNNKKIHYLMNIKDNYKLTA